MKLHKTFTLEELETTLPDLEKVRDIAASNGVMLPLSLIFDTEKPERFPTSSKPHKKNGYYQFTKTSYGVYGIFGDWSIHSDPVVMNATNKPLSQIEHSKMMAEIEAYKEKAQKLKEERNAQAMQEAKLIWDNASHASIDHPYIKSKGLQSTHGARLHSDGSIITPIYNEKLEITGLQYITQSGFKKALEGSVISGGFWVLGDIQDRIYVCEGYATAATVKEETGYAAATVFGVNNLLKGTESIKKVYPDVKIIIAADNDSNKKNNTGMIEAEKVANTLACEFIAPPIAGDFNDYRLSGEEVKHLLVIDDKEEWFIDITDLVKTPKPTKWLVKRWLQEKALIMVHGESGCGKTFVVLDMALRIALNSGSWQGFNVKNHPVVYLAGEGHDGIAKRVKGWLQYNHIEEISKRFVVSKTGTDLNKPSGLNKVIFNISKLPDSPGLIIVDTLHRFFDGNENEAASVREMIVACDQLKHKYNCSVLLVHHTGVSSEAKERGRGSTAWKGALENELSVQKCGEDKIKVVSKKNKDDGEPEELFLEKRKIDVIGWLDEDGEQETTLILEPTVRPKEKKDKTLTNDIKSIIIAWKENSGELTEMGEPYITRSAWKNSIITNDGKTDAAAEKRVKPSGKASATRLIEANIIKEFQHGFLIIDDEIISSLTMNNGK